MPQDSEQTDNHKTVNDLIPSSLWGEDVFIDAQKVKKNLLDIKTKIAPCKPRIIGVTKYYGLSSIINGFEAGLRDFGESRAQDAVHKIEQLPAEVKKNSEFHFIGHLQTNKVRMVVENFNYIHSVDSLKLAKAVSDTACGLNKREKILIQVNNAGEEQKSGYTVDNLKQEFSKFLELKGVEIIGLMNMAPLGASEGKLHKTFGELRELKESLEKEFGIILPELSMGMSDDFDIAVEEGATMIRIGRKLFT